MAVSLLCPLAKRCTTSPTTPAIWRVERAARCDSSRHRRLARYRLSTLSYAFAVLRNVSQCPSGLSGLPPQTEPARIRAEDFPRLGSPTMLKPIVARCRRGSRGAINAQITAKASNGLPEQNSVVLVCHDSRSPLGIHFFASTRSPRSTRFCLERAPYNRYGVANRPRCQPCENRTLKVSF